VRRLDELLACNITVSPYQGRLALFMYINHPNLHSDDPRTGPASSNTQNTGKKEQKNPNVLEHTLIVFKRRQEK